MTDGTPYAFPINEYRSTTAAKGMTMIPKRGLDIEKCETARFLKLTSNAVEPLHVYVPRKVFTSINCSIIIVAEVITLFSDLV